MSDFDFFAPGFYDSFNNKSTPTERGIDLPLESIIVNDQVRKDFKPEDISALARSIDKIGCIEPIIVWGPDVNCGRKYHLVCGELRFRAHRQLGRTTIKACIIDKPKSAEDLKILQVAENYSRHNLSPFEVADALTQLHGILDNADLMAIFSLGQTSIWAYRQISTLNDRERHLLSALSLSELLKYCDLKKRNPHKAEAFLTQIEAGKNPQLAKRNRRTAAQLSAAGLKKYEATIAEVKKRMTAFTGRSKSI